jgi:hypothetical protein
MTPMLLKAMLKILQMRWLHKPFILAYENMMYFLFSICSGAAKENLFVVLLIRF